MKILLVKPDLASPTIAGNNFVELEPLELEYLAAMLSDHDVELIDLRFDGYLEKRITDFSPDIVASTAYSVHYYRIVKVMQTAKRLLPHVYTVVGGHHATMMPNDFNRKGIDYIVLGEGIFSFAELVTCLERGEQPAQVAGLGIRTNSKMVFTDSRSDHQHIDQFPFPDRSLTREYRKKFFYLWWRPAALIRTSVGCVYRCSFCPIWTATKGVCKCRSPESVAQELTTIEEDFVYFCDDNAFYNPGKMNILADIIMMRGIRKEFFVFSRADAVVENTGLIEKWAEIGLKQVFLGIETVDTERLKPLHKNVMPNAGETAIRILKKNGIEPFVGFVIFPDFTREDFDNIYEYLNKNEIYFHELTILTPAPGSELYHQRKEELTSVDYRLYDYLHAVLPTKMNLQDLYRELANLYIRGYSPWRALRTKSVGNIPLNPIYITKVIFNTLKDYVAIKNAYRSQQFL